MVIKLITFASIKDILGFSSREMEISDNSTVKDVLKILIEQNKKLIEEQDFLLFAVNETYCTKNHKLNNRDTLAIFPPVSGG